MKKKYEIGKSMLEILRDVAGAVYDFRLDQNTVRMGEFVGTDKRESVRYERDVQSPRGMNIENIEMVRDGENIANYVLTKIASSPPYSVEDTASQAEYGLVEKYITVNADEAVTPSRYLEEHKSGVTDIAFSPIGRKYNEVEVGDVVSVWIA